MLQQEKQIDRRCSLYIHIPFCIKKCDYCDFFSVPCKAVSDEYIDAVLSEISFYRTFYKIDEWKTVYIGGGTPSLLAPTQLLRLVESVSARAPDCEVTVEANPDDITEDFLKACSSCGVTRLSVGIQALDDKALEKVHRRCSRESILNTLDLLKRLWKGRLSCDIIAGLPCQSEKSFISGLEELVSFPVEHISLYTLTVEDGTPLALNIASGSVLWSPSSADRKWIAGRNFLEKQGFYQYEVSNFAKPGCESRHNMTYWKLENYVGCGAGATGTWYGVRKSGDGCTDGTRWTNTRAIESYCSFWNDKAHKDDIPRSIETLSGATQEFEYLMMGFRTISGVDDKVFYNRFGKSLSERIGVEGGVFSEWEKKGLARAKCDNDGSDVFYSLTKRGILLLNRFLEEV